MRMSLALWALFSFGACGGAEERVVLAPSDAPHTAPRPPAPPPFAPIEAEVARTTGRIRSIQPAPDGRWIVSRLLGAGALPGVIPAGGSEIAAIEGWRASDVLALRSSADGSQIAFTRTTDPANPEVWVRPTAGGEGRRVSAGYLLAWLDATHVLALAGTSTNFAAASLDVVDVASGTARTVVPAATGQLFRGAAGSPDGSTIAFLRYPQASGGVLEPSDVFTVPAAGGDPRRLTTDSASCLDLAWTADGAWILHSAERGAGRDIWAVAASGGDPIRVTGTPGEDGVPAVSADGRALRYATFEDARAKVLLYESGRGTPPRVLSEGDADRIQPVLSPDGFQIAYVIASGNASNVVLGRVDDGTSRPLTETAEPEAYPAWSADGSALAYLSPREGSLEIVLHLLPSGEEARRPQQPVRAAEPTLTHGANVMGGVPKFSPDGRNLLYPSTRNGQTALMRLPLGGGDPVEVAPLVLSYAWDPILPAVLFVRPKQGGGTELVRVRLEGRRPPEVLRVDVARTSLVGPALEGNAVYVVTDAEKVSVQKLDLRTGSRDLLVELPDNVDPLRLSIDVSRDGRFVAAAVSLVTTRVREMRNFGEIRGR